MYIFKLNPSSFNTPYDVGYLENQLERMMKKNQNEKVILFIDEIDGIAPQRDDQHSGNSDNMVTSLLTFINKMNDKCRNKVFIVAATNFLNKVDNAVCRDGRFNNKYFVGNPNIEIRKNIITKLFENSKEEKKIKLLCLMTIGHSAATVKKYTESFLDRSYNDMEEIFIKSYLMNGDRKVKFGEQEEDFGVIKSKIQKYLVDNIFNEGIFTTTISDLELKDSSISNVEGILNSNAIIKLQFDLKNLGIKNSREDKSIKEAIISISSDFKTILSDFKTMNSHLSKILDSKNQSDEVLKDLIQEMHKLITLSNESISKNTQENTKLITESMQCIKNLSSQIVDQFYKILGESIKEQSSAFKELAEGILSEMQVNAKKMSVGFFAVIQESIKKKYRK